MSMRMEHTTKHIVIDWLLRLRDCVSECECAVLAITIEQRGTVFADADCTAKTMCKILMKRKKCILEIYTTRDAPMIFDSAVW